MAEINIKDVKDYLLGKQKSEDTLKGQVRDQIISDLKSQHTLWRKYKLERVYLYGSFIDLTFNKHSDIDIAIEPELDFNDQLKLYTEINRKITQEVEVRLLKELPFSEKVIREGMVIYERKDSNS